MIIHLLSFSNTPPILNIQREDFKKYKLIPARALHCVAAINMGRASDLEIAVSRKSSVKVDIISMKKIDCICLHDK